MRSTAAPLATCGGSVDRLQGLTPRDSSLLPRARSDPELAGITSYYKFIRTKYPNVGMRHSAFQKPQPGDFLTASRARPPLKRANSRSLLERGGAAHAGETAE